MITIDKVKKDYYSFKKNAINLMQEGKYADAEKFIMAASKIAYNFNFIYKDKDLDLLLEQLSDVYIKKNHFDKVRDRYVFFDSFGYDNRGLTQQYIRALISWGVEFIYILESESSQSEAILNEIESYDKATTFLIPKKATNKEKAQIIYDLVADFKADKAFLHITPWSTTAIASWIALPNVTRYFIDLTDHAFWLGSEFCDLYIGFRDYGYFISEKFREIPRDKYITVPYYPIVEGSVGFQGFDMDLSGKKVVFTGGTYYKMYGKGGVFLNILKRICFDNPDAVVLVGGSGDGRIFRRFIIENELDDQIFLIGNRKDIVGVFENIDVFINTYPIGGGLMSQLAVSKNKPTIGYCTDDMPMSFSEGLFKNSGEFKLTYSDLEDFHSKVNTMLSQVSHVEGMGLDYSVLNITPSEFSSDLRQKLTKRRVMSEPEGFPGFCNDEVVNLYLEVENEYLKKYEYLKLSALRLTYAKYDFLGFILCFFWCGRVKILNKLLGR